MNIGIAIVCRFNSSRFPGKILHVVQKNTVLENIIYRIKKNLPKNEICVATSINKSDDVIYDLCKERNFNIYRGDLNDVSGRLLKCAKENNWDYFVRINGDSPLIDFRIVDKAFKIFKKNKYEIVTNTFIRSYPKGQSVEIIKSSIFLESRNKILKNKIYKEHVTKYFYDNSKKFTIYNFRNVKNLSKINLSVDTAIDFKKITKISNNLKKNFKWQTAARRYIDLRE